MSVLRLSKVKITILCRDRERNGHGTKSLSLLYSRESDFIHNTVPYRTVPYRTVPYRTVPYRTVPYRTVPYRTVPYRTVPYRTVPYRTVPYRTVPYRTVPYRTVPYRTVPYRTVPYRTVPYPTVFCYNFFHARGLLARGVPFFLPKILRFSAKKNKSANRTVFKIKTVLAF
jgi:hypothetical protein